MKKSIFTFLLIGGLSLYPNYSNLNETTKQKITFENKNEKPWESPRDYDLFIKNMVKKNYKKTIEETYNFYGIKRDLPKYGFKEKEPIFTFFDCEGAVYKENQDSIYFYSVCSQEMLEKYMEYYKNENIKNNLEKRLIYYISHEAAHAFFYNRGKELNAKYLFKKRKILNPIENIKENMISEGVAEYISHRGVLKKSSLNDDYFEKMIKEKNDFYLYEMGFILVKPILDKNFKKGIDELIKNPLKDDDLKNLLEYREKIMKKL